MRRAVAEARAQDAPWLEMIALSALCGRKGASAQEREALARAVQNVESHDISPVKRAHALLAGSGM
jgi:hypothetical protein